MPKWPRIEQVPFLGALEAVGPRRMGLVNEADTARRDESPGILRKVGRRDCRSHTGQRHQKDTEPTKQGSQSSETEQSGSLRGSDLGPLLLLCGSRG